MVFWMILLPYIPQIHNLKSDLFKIDVHKDRIFNVDLSLAIHAILWLHCANFWLTHDALQWDKVLVLLA